MEIEIKLKTTKEIFEKTKLRLEKEGTKNNMISTFPL